MPRPRVEWLLVFVPVAAALELLGGADVAVFVVSAVGIIPLAALIGKATDELAKSAGPRTGGLLNATFGNVTELIIAVFLLGRGEIDIVKASMTGSIIGNALLVTGLAFLVGGWGREEQEFSRRAAGLHTVGLVIAVAALLMPALFALTPESTHYRKEAVSIGVAIVLIAVYGLNMLFYLKTHRSLFRETFDPGRAQWSRGRAMAMLGGSIVVVAALSEFLVGALEPTVRDLGLSRLFVGLIVVPIVGNAAEHAAAVFLAAKDKVEISIDIAIGSSAQIALFVAPILVFVSLVVGHPMNFIFTGLEIGAVAFSTLILAFVVADGRSNWLEGAQLLAVYVIMAFSFFFL